MTRPIVALVSDLIFQSRIQAVAAHLGLTVCCVRSAPAVDRLADQAAALILDLNADPSVLELLARLRSRPDLPMVGFLSHVQVELARRARQAGLERVMSRSAFTRRLPVLLRQLASPADASASSESGPQHLRAPGPAASGADPPVCPGDPQPGA